MRMYDIIEKKRDGKSLTKDEISFVIDGMIKKEIPDYQISSLLMAIYLNGMNDTETTYLTDAMAHSGDMINLSEMFGDTVDKHSTGGVGDTVTLLVGPMVAAMGMHMVKMSGKGLGLTGGTIDKLEAIPGMNLKLSKEELIKKVLRYPEMKKYLDIIIAQEQKQKIVNSKTPPRAK